MNQSDNNDGALKCVHCLTAVVLFLPTPQVVSVPLRGADSDKQSNSNIINQTFGYN